MDYTGVKGQSLQEVVWGAPGDVGLPPARCRVKLQAAEGGGGGGKRGGGGGGGGGERNKRETSVNIIKLALNLCR